MTKIIAYTDGGARGNPGPAGLGVVLYNEQGKIVSRHKAFLGVQTNNQAEYKAVIVALTEALNHGADELELRADSKLIIEQLKGNYRVKDKILGQLFVKVWNLRHRFKKIILVHVPRARNKVADALANEAMDEGV
ncbi:MAG: hypothetical protein A3F54_04675 [Candidatus Kerfeldbacteria bacterium RIFCSPHIGHO2_12_FULL_48_17]|uniref:RNase H type-1 domain-containing protein n=1 Tax=Candidatus Kerfeldbacteria bacterium RIFCSPHIGHO2_12_FULL_48_17 TaxID=1798542 RepID=A0A1G2B0U6_9BACT|nr:MAG: hypothetical protein A3F54_04675 [Candidatus Kerfeldbacteria bacterium RIFCSPHIGHO2_12_FULL_48_17]